MASVHTSRHWPDILLCIVLWSLGGLAGPMLFPVLPEIAKGLEVTQQSTLNAIPAFFLGFALSHFAVGLIVRRATLAEAVVTCLLLYASASLIAANGTFVETILVACFVQGLAYGGLPVAVRMVLSRDRDAETAKRDLSFVAGVVLLVPIVSPILGSLLASEWGWQAVFWAQGLSAIAMAVPVLLVRTGTFRAAPDPKEQPGERKSLLSELAAIFRRKPEAVAILQMVLLSGLVALIQFDIARIVPLLDDRSIHNTSIVIGFSFACVALGSFMASRLRMSFHVCLTLTLLLCIFYAVLGWIGVSSLTPFTIGVCLVSLGTGSTVWVATSNAMMISSDPSLMRSAAVGFTQYIGSFAIITAAGLFTPAVPAAHFLSAGVLIFLVLGLAVINANLPSSDRPAKSSRNYVERDCRSVEKA